MVLCWKQKGLFLLKILYLLCLLLFTLSHNTEVPRNLNIRRDGQYCHRFEQPPFEGDGEKAWKELWKFIFSNLEMFYTKLTSHLKKKYHLGSTCLLLSRWGTEEMSGWPRLTKGIHLTGKSKNYCEYSPAPVNSASVSIVYSLHLQSALIFTNPFISPLPATPLTMTPLKSIASDYKYSPWLISLNETISLIQSCMSELNKHGYWLQPNRSTHCKQIDLPLDSSYK